MPAAAYRDDGLALLRSRAFIKNHLERAVAFVNRTREGKDRRKRDAVGSDGSKVPFGDAKRHHPFATPVRWQGIELAGTSPGAVAATSFFAFEVPCHRCHVMPPLEVVVERSN